jgi:hypothetical protein
LVLIVGKLFEISSIAAIQVGLMLAPGGEFVFIAFGEAVNEVSFCLLMILGVNFSSTSKNRSIISFVLQLISHIYIYIYIYINKPRNLNLDSEMDQTNVEVVMLSLLSLHKHVLLLMKRLSNCLFFSSILINLM